MNTISHCPTSGAAVGSHTVPVWSVLQVRMAVFKKMRLSNPENMGCGGHSYSRFLFEPLKEVSSVFYRRPHWLTSLLMAYQPMRSPIEHGLNLKKIIIIIIVDHKSRVNYKDFLNFQFSSSNHTQLRNIQLRLYA